MRSLLERFRVWHTSMLSRSRQLILIDGINLQTLLTMHNPNVIIFTNLGLVVDFLSDFGLFLKTAENLVKIQIIIVGLVGMAIVISMPYDANIFVTERVLVDINAAKNQRSKLIDISNNQNGKETSDTNHECVNRFIVVSGLSPDNHGH